MDFGDFEKTFYKLVQQSIPKNVEKGLFNGMNELLRLAKYEEPQCPKDVGDLWGSTAGTVTPKVTPSEISVEGGFNSEYAARWHEYPDREKEPSKAKPVDDINWTTNKGASRPGPKFLESKMVRHKDAIIGIAAKTIENLLEK